MFSDTKFLAPRVRSTLVPRTALVQRLVCTDARPLTIVVGPAGTGKSSILAEWYRYADDGSVAWLSADRNDTDPTRFWRAFIAAVQTIEPTFGIDAADAMTLDGVITPDALESLLVDDQMELTRRIRLVIDDFQFVSADAVLQLRQLLERGLTQVRLLIGSRSEPALGLHRLRLQNDVFEVHESDLRLDLDQTHELISKIGLDPTGIDLPLLHSRTEGWAAGIHLAALSALGSADPAASLRALGGSSQSIAGYLAAEVLANQPDRIRRFLEDTCVVDELDEQMCEALTADRTSPPVRIEPSTAMHRRCPRSKRRTSSCRGSTTPERCSATTSCSVTCCATSCVRAIRRASASNTVLLPTSTCAVRTSRQPSTTTGLPVSDDLAARVINENLLAVLHSNSTLPPIDLHVDIATHDPRTAVGEVAGYAAALLMSGRHAEARSLLEQIDLSAPALSAVDRMHLHCLWLPAKFMLGDSTARRRRRIESSTSWSARAVQADEWVTMAIPLAIKAYAWEGNFARVDQLVDLFRPSFNPDLERADLVAAVAFAHYEEGMFADAVRGAESVRNYALATGIGDGGIDVVTRAVLGCALVEMGEFDAAAGASRCGSLVDPHRADPHLRAWRRSGGRA